MENIFRNIPPSLPEEFFDTLVSSENLSIERIVSRGHTTPEGEWYDQGRNEFVLLLRGAARLEFEDGLEVNLCPGDCLDIPAHRRHRVAWTDETGDTVWLAVHYS